MIYKNMELFNIRAVEKDASFMGERLVRIPEKVRMRINSRGRLHGAQATCGEVRFVTDAPHFTIRLMARTLSTWTERVTPQMRIMRGSLEYDRVELPLDKMVSFSFDTDFIELVRPEVLRPNPDYGFATNVWRFVLPAYEIIFGSIETHGYEIRPPSETETPSVKCLCYGSSITNSYLDGWPSLMGHYLGIDVMNLGLAGGCCIESEFADYISGMSEEYDSIILELGINVVNEISTDEFAIRTEYMLDKITRINPEINIIMINIFPYAGDQSLWTEKRIKEHGNSGSVKEFRNIIRNKGNKFRNKNFNISVIEGDDINIPSTCWSYDMLHPRYLGNSVIAFKLAEIIKKEWNL